MDVTDLFFNAMPTALHVSPARKMIKADTRKNDSALYPVISSLKEKKPVLIIAMRPITRKGQAIPVQPNRLATRPFLTGLSGDEKKLIAGSNHTLYFWENI